MEQPKQFEQAVPKEHGEAADAPQKLFWSSFRALLPTLAFDVGGTMLVYFVLSRFFANTSIWPLLGASLVPSISNVFNFVRRGSIDIVGIIVLIGLLVGIVPALFGGSPRLLLVRESFVTGLVGLVLLVSGFFRRPLAYYVVREFLTANEALPHERFLLLWDDWKFRRGIRIMTIAWGALLLGEFVARAFMALRMNVAFVLGAAPLMFTLLLLVAGAINAVWLGRAIRRVFSA